MGNLETRLSGVEEKLQKRSKTKSKGSRDVNQIHIFPFDAADDFVKMALIDDSKKKNDCYPVIEFQMIDFKKLGNLILHNDMKYVEWEAFNSTKEVAKFENNELVICA